MNHTHSLLPQVNHPLLSNNPHVLVPFLELKLYLENENPDLSSFTSPRLFSTHMPYVSLPKSVHDSQSKLVYLCRNPKDTLVSLWFFTNKLRLKEMGTNPLEDAFEKFCAGVLVSLWFFTNKLRLKEMGTNPLEDAFEKFCAGVSIYGPFWDHMLGYWKESLNNPQRVFFLKYEEMKEQPELHLKKLADFLGCSFSSKEEEERTVDDILEICSFDNLSNLKVNKEGKLPSGEDFSAFFRKGEVGDWKNHLTPEMVERLDNICEEKFQGSGLKF
ncbi:Sulfotransferase domain-containing protein [Cynara cardunculus var. scolymus]|uniref:Sulfotransferase n=2 Tax=Cynara cardunculus var. scolymus TaxID=59895 RepID=A0A103XT22_CYNCS|nr:Sulfotransferase domain-containing protein [Cynara cardunculus var. scolymus]